jgi:hypothetical protein
MSKKRDHERDAKRAVEIVTFAEERAATQTV